MQTTRVTYLSILGVNAALNGLAILQVAGLIRGIDGMVSAALLFNLILIPVAIPWAYRIGEMAEEEYRRKLKKPAKDGKRPATGCIHPPATAKDDAQTASDQGIGGKDRG